LNEKSFKKREFNFSEKQVAILEKMFDPESKIVFLSGPAGTSKSFISIYAALHLLKENPDKKILYIRTAIESASKSLGALPGTENEKFLPYMMPILDKVEEIINDEPAKALFSTDIVSAIPVNYLRGASWRDKIVIFDESQNANKKELTTVLTRIGEGTKVFVLGDPSQSDINGQSGFASFFKAFTSAHCEDRGIYSFEFGKEDIVRSEILKFIVERIEGIEPPKH
jgi:phosphate starvation-inducible PhoH-like protein